MGTDALNDLDILAQFTLGCRLDILPCLGYASIAHLLLMVYESKVDSSCTIGGLVSRLFLLQPWILGVSRCYCCILGQLSFPAFRGTYLAGLLFPASNAFTPTCGCAVLARALSRFGF